VPQPVIKWTCNPEAEIFTPMKAHRIHVRYIFTYIYTFTIKNKHSCLGKYIKYTLPTMDPIMGKDPIETPKFETNESGGMFTGNWTCRILKIDGFVPVGKGLHLYIPMTWGFWMFRHLNPMKIGKGGWILRVWSFRDI